MVIATVVKFCSTCHSWCGSEINKHTFITAHNLIVNKYRQHRQTFTFICIDIYRHRSADWHFLLCLQIVTCESGRCDPGAGLAATPSSEPRYSCTSQTLYGVTRSGANRVKTSPRTQTFMRPATTLTLSFRSTLRVFNRFNYILWRRHILVWKDEITSKY